MALGGNHGQSRRFPAAHRCQRPPDANQPASRAAQLLISYPYVGSPSSQAVPNVISPAAVPFRRERDARGYPLTLRWKARIDALGS
jgi:hypothetical protein